MRNKIKQDASTILLFLISFLMSFVVIYAGMNHYRQIKEVMAERGQESSLYYTRICFVEAEQELLECPITSGNVFLQYSETVGNDVFNPVTLDILWNSHEELREGVYEQPYLSELKGEETYVLIGSGLKKYTSKKENRLFIKINGQECVVGGILKPNDFEESDRRCIMLPLSREAVKRYQEPECAVVYKSSEMDARDELIQWVSGFAEVDEEADGNVDDFDDSMSYSIIEMYQNIISLLLEMLIIFCLVNAAFLSYFWGKKQLYEYMLKRTLGYTRAKIFKEILLWFMALEGGTLLVSLLLTFIYELVQNRPEIWLRNLQSGFGILLIGFLGMGFVISMLPMAWVIKSNPIDVLRTRE